MKLAICLCGENNFDLRNDWAHNLYKFTCRYCDRAYSLRTIDCMFDNDIERTLQLIINNSPIDGEEISRKADLLFKEYEFI